MEAMMQGVSLSIRRVGCVERSRSVATRKRRRVLQGMVMVVVVMVWWRGFINKVSSHNYALPASIIHSEKVARRRRGNNCCLI